ncbi:MAG TPA: SIS domain-containing protein [Pyrinomonadaceae bacterium]|jgi:D-sedoheptulose 7-phosphate isomerase
MLKAVGPTALEENIEEAMAVLESLLDLQEQIEAASTLIAKALTTRHKLLACGNGGSAADAAHMTTEFVCRFDGDRRPYPALCLATHGGDLTAVGNDYAFEDIFSRQVEAFAQKGDILVAFTTSGNSENVRRALESATRVGIDSIAFLGRNGGKCKGLATVELIVSNDSTARIQEAHQLLLHTICEMVEESLY